MSIKKYMGHAADKEDVHLLFSGGQGSGMKSVMRGLKSSMVSVLKSVRVRIFLMTAILSWTPLFALDTYIYHSTQKKQVDAYLDEIMYQASAMTRQMASSSYMPNLSDNPALNNSCNAQLNILADIYDGRILVIDSGYMIVKDTYNSDNGRYDLSGQVLSCMSGNSTGSTLYDKESCYIECTVPIYDVRMEDVSGVMVFTSNTTKIINSIYRQMLQYRTVEVAMCILLSLMAFFGSAHLMRPFKRLEREFMRATQGDLTPIEVSDYVETERIAGVYNESLLRLKHLDESRQEFVSNVSHELKTPITSIRILADSLSTMEGAPVELYQEFMSDISNEIDRESKIIDDLLEMVRLNRTNASLSVEHLDINQLLESILKRLKPVADKRGLVITLECLRQVEADVDEMKFSRMITNLVENAIKYNKDNGTIDVSLNADQSYFYIKIVDSGVGIPADQLDKIFERFHRVDKARSRETGGTGLGLAICKDIALLHHGMIRVSSDYGEGSTFIVRIPLVYIP